MLADLFTLQLGWQEQRGRGCSACSKQGRAGLYKTQTWQGRRQHMACSATKNMATFVALAVAYFQDIPCTQWYSSAAVIHWSGA